MEGQCIFEQDVTWTIEPRRDHAVATLDADLLASCPVCDGEGVVFIENPDGYGEVRDCEAMRNVTRRLDCFNAARLPARYHDKSFENFERYADAKMARPRGNLVEVTTKVYKMAESFVPGDAGMLLVGPVGTGKTHLLCALLRHLTLEKGMSVRFIEFTHLLGELREAYEHGDGAQALVDRLASVPVLAIDELGKGRKTDWQLGIIDELISKRYNRCLSTFFTSNYPLERKGSSRSSVVDTSNPQFASRMVTETLTDRLDERIVSRIHEMGSVVEIAGVRDYRRF